MIRRTRDLTAISNAAKCAFSEAANKVWHVADQSRTPVLVWDKTKDSIKEISEDFLRSNPDLIRLECEHRYWLRSFDDRYTRGWEDRLNRTFDDAIIEAAVRRLLQENGCDVSPNEDLLANAEPRPDFRCVRDNVTFYVEVTSFDRNAVTKRSGLVPGHRGVSFFAGIYLNVWNKWSTPEKLAQCQQESSPTLLAIGTLHDAVGIFFDRPFIERTYARYDPTLRSRPESDGQIGDVDRLISGLLFINVFSCSSSGYVTRGVIHPNASHPFDPQWLPTVDFGRLTDSGRSGKMHVEWMKPE